MYTLSLCENGHKGRAMDGHSSVKVHTYNNDDDLCFGKNRVPTVGLTFLNLIMISAYAKWQQKFF